MRGAGGRSRTLAQGYLGCWDHPSRTQGEEGSTTEMSPSCPHWLEKNFFEMFPLKMYQGIRHPFLPCLPPVCPQDSLQTLFTGTEGETEDNYNSLEVKIQGAV